MVSGLDQEPGCVVAVRDFVEFLRRLGWGLCRSYGSSRIWRHCLPGVQLHLLAWLVGSRIQ